MYPEFRSSVCPHDCPSACPLEVEVKDARTIGQVRGAADHPYSKGVICAKVGRYAERTHHPDRLTVPLIRDGAKGEGRFREAAWDEAMDRVATALADAADRFGAEAVWPYYYGGTMGAVQRDGILRLRRLMGYSAMGRTICSAPARAGWVAGVGAMLGADPREIEKSDLVIFWGCNAVATQIQTWNLALAARKTHGARIVVVDPYRNPTAAKADLHLALRPGTDGALASAMMHVLFAEGLADRDYLARMTDFPPELEAHLAARSPEWAAPITGLDAATIRAFAREYGRTERSLIRLGLGFSRSRNGPANIHAVSCLPAVTGAWRHEGGGALLMTSGAFSIDRALIEGLDVPDPGGRTLDMSRLGSVLGGDRDALGDGPPVTAMIVQNVNPAVVAPETALVRAGLSRDDLFLCVHEQFMTETARYADVVLPATTFVEHDDLYTSYGQTFLQVGRRLIEPLGQARSNHEVISDLAERLGAHHPANRMTAWEVIDATLARSNLPGAEALADQRWFDCAKGFEDTHFVNGFGHADGRFRFAPDWKGAKGMPALPDHMAAIEEASPETPFRLVTAPARNFLNTSFTPTPTSRAREGRPAALIHPEALTALGIKDGDRVRVGNGRGSVVVAARAFDGLHRGVVVVESLWGDADFEEGTGINLLVGSDPIAPDGGAAFHDTAVWLARA